MNMDILDDFIIDEPYTLTDEDKQAIRKASPDTYHSDDWEKSCLSDFKKHLKDYLRTKQHCRCAYCRMKIKEGQASSEIEHIIQKSRKSEWMYTPLNLCLSCKRCNTAKHHTKDTIRDYNVQEFPTDSASYLFINPYYDKYSDHIEIVDDILYKGKTVKGKYTVTLCRLNRYELAADRAEDVITKGENGYIKLMILLLEPNRQALIDNWDEFVERIKLFDPIATYKMEHQL